MTKTQRKIVNRIRALYEEHDHSEAMLVMMARRGARCCPGAWATHDDLERTIVEAEAKLPQSIVEKLKRGDL